MALEENGTFTDQGYAVSYTHLDVYKRQGAWSVEIWKRFRKWGGIPTGITQNIKDLLASPEIENIFLSLIHIAAGTADGKTYGKAHRRGKA